MPAIVRKRTSRAKSGKKKVRFVVVEKSTGKLVRNRAGTPVKKGGHTTRAAAVRQARAINANS